MMDHSTDEREPAGLARLAKRFPVTVLLALTFGLSYPLMSLAVMAQYGVIPGKSLPQLVGLDMERAASMLLVLSLIAATFLTTASLIGMVLRGAANSILLAAITHTFFNRSNNIDGIAADLLEGGNQPIAALLAATLLAVVLGVCLRRNLRRSHRKALDEAEEHVPVASRQPVAA